MSRAPKDLSSPCPHVWLGRDSVLCYKLNSDGRLREELQLCHQRVTLYTTFQGIFRPGLASFQGIRPSRASAHPTLPYDLSQGCLFSSDPNPSCSLSRDSCLQAQGRESGRMLLEKLS